MFIHYLTHYLRRIIPVGIVVFLISSMWVYAQDTRQRVNGLAWNRDGAKLAIGFADGTLQIIDGVSYQTLTSLQLAQEGFNAINEVVWNPIDANVLAVTGGHSGNRQAKAWVLDTIDDSVIFRFEDVQSIRSMAWSPNGTRLAISIDFIADNLGNRHVQIWDVLSNQLTLRISVGSHAVTSLAWSPDGSRLAGTSTDSSVIIWETLHGETILTLMGHSAVVNDVVWNPEGTLLATSSEISDSTVRIWDANTGESIRIVPNLYASKLAWSPDGAQLAALNIARAVEVFDASSGQRIDTFPSGALASDIAYSPSGGRLAFDERPSAALQPEDNRDRQILTVGGAVQIVVPTPSLERLQAIADACNAPAAVERVLPTSAAAGQLAEFVGRVEALPENTIPPACAADLIAVAEALQSR